MPRRADPHKRPSKDQMAGRVSIDAAAIDLEAVLQALRTIDRDAPDVEAQRTRDPATEA